MSYQINSFPTEEYTARIKGARAEMAMRGLDCLIISDPSNMAWISGYDGWSFYVHQAVVLGMEGNPVFWGRGMDAIGAQRTVFMGDDDIVGYPDYLVQNAEIHTMTDLVGLLKARGYESARIGVELDNYYYSAAAHITLVTHLPEAVFLDANGLINWQRAIKSPREIAYLRGAASITDKMHATILERAEPGMRKNDLVAEIYAAGIRGTDAFWGDYPAIVPLAPSGLDATAAHLTWDGAPLRKNESTFFEIAGVHRRYHVPQSRTLFLGAAPQKYLDAESAVLDAVDAGLEQAKPGNLCEDIANAFNAALNAAGFNKDGRCGYSIGLSYPPDWGERTMSFRAGDKSVLKPGMTFHFMPALWLDDGGLEITEPILITETGCECLCTTERRLFVKP